MLEDLYRQIEDAEATMRGAQARLGNIKQAQEEMTGIVGRGEALDGLVSIEATTADGLRALDLNPRVMRLPSTELAEGILEAIRAANDDLRAQMQDMFRRTGAIADEREAVDVEQLQARLQGASQRFTSSARSAAEEIAYGQQLRRR